MLRRHPRGVDKVVIMGESRPDRDSASNDRDGILDRETERSMGVLEVALLVGVLVVFLLVVVFFAVTR